MIYLLPWKKINNDKYIRYIFGDINHKLIHMAVFKLNDNIWHHTSIKFIDYNSKKAAMVACDKQQADAGWRFISEERAEKLKVLL